MFLYDTLTRRALETKTVQGSQRRLATWIDLRAFGSSCILLKLYDCVSNRGCFTPVGEKPESRMETKIEQLCQGKEKKISIKECK